MRSHAREGVVHNRPRRGWASGGDADEVVQAFQPLLASLSSRLVAEKLLRHEQGRVRSWIRASLGGGALMLRPARGLRVGPLFGVLLPVVLGLALGLLHVRLGVGTLFTAGATPSSTSGGGAWRGGGSFRRAPAGAGGACDASVRHGAEAARESLTCLNPLPGAPNVGE